MPNPERHTFELEMEVRDYECDLQGIVNNAVYLHYLEHARHVFLKSRGVDFAQLSLEGTNLVVVRVELDYLRSLRSEDRFQVSIKTERVSRLRFAFLQEIVLLPDLKPVLRGKVIGTALNAQGRPFVPDFVAQLWPDAP
jgi:acyl-CoA thioester hydrolase